MPATDKRIDNYIGKSAAFAQPILTHLRKLIHRACPDAEETIKWGMPYFQNNGANLCSMAAFKAHCAFGFWKASIMKDPEKILQLKEKNAMGHMDRITSLSDLPKDSIMLAYIRDAAHLNRQNIRIPPREKADRPKKFLMPKALAGALEKNKKAKAQFDAFSDSHKYEYIEWVAEAKTEPTREKRIETTIEWLNQGKSRNWKYNRKKNT